MRSIARLVAVSGLSVALASFGALLSPPAPVAAATHTVQITDSAFATPVLTVRVGDTVTWTNVDDRPHTVTGQDGSFDSGNIDEGGTFSFTFTQAGTYDYLCEYHSEMRATIVVEAASAPAPATTASQAPAASAAVAPASSHDGGHVAGGEQPNTALPAPASGAGIPPISYVMWGAAFLLLAYAFAPRLSRVARASAPRPRGGWRR
ncbi:MAG TPA: cupredoxin family copper-binding protein [Candidatus Limnocylindria bacterium]|nr:cupredoxin family copper-binding protein [Candidatus Limnocylindria bacterium]